jgi:hypothetical protein
MTIKNLALQYAKKQNSQHCKWNERTYCLEYFNYEGKMIGYISGSLILSGGMEAIRFFEVNRLRMRRV